MGIIGLREQVTAKKSKKLHNPVVWTFYPVFMIIIMNCPTE